MARKQKQSEQKVANNERVNPLALAITHTAPASPADTAKAGVFVRPLADGSVIISRETPRQRLRRLRRLRQLYAQQASEIFWNAVHEESEKLEARTRVAFILTSARIRTYLLRKRLLAMSGLPLNGIGNMGIKPKGQSICDNYGSEILASEVLIQSVTRAPPSGEALKLCQALLFTPSDVWLGFVSPRAERAPTHRAARAGALAG